MGYIYVGKITSTHGLKGELKLKSSFVYINSILKKGFSFYIGLSKQEVSLLKYRYHNGMYLLTFREYEDINLVEDFRNSDIYVKKEDIKLEEGQFLFEDYIGLKAYYDGNNIGIVKDIVDCGNNNYVFYIIGDKEVLIPLNKNFIEKVVLNDKIIFKEVGGLIDAN